MRVFVAAVFILALHSAACRKGPFRVFTAGSGEFACEVPADWEHLPEVESDGRHLGIVSPEDEGWAPASLMVAVVPQMSAAEVNAEEAAARKQFEGDPNFALEPMRDYSAGAIRGRGFSVFYTREEGAVHHLPAGVERPEPVAYRQTSVYLDVLGGTVSIDFGAPIGLYAKHEPVFLRLLQTFEWRGGGKGG